MTLAHDLIQFYDEWELTLPTDARAVLQVLVDGARALNPASFCANDGTCSCAKFGADPKDCEQRLERLSVQGMADCMDMVRSELVEAGVIPASVPPMFVTEAVLQHVIGLQRKLIDANAEIAALLLARDAPRNFCGRCGKHLNVAGVHTCTPPTENQE